MDKAQANIIIQSLTKFVNWHDNFGETSYDHQCYYAGPMGGRAKALYYRKPLIGTMAVAPVIFSEAFLPSARRLFWHPQRFPIADAHYAMGFAFLYQTIGDKKYYEKAVHFLDVLQETRSPGFKNHGWGYPFDWVTRNGVLPARTPMITTVPYVYEAFSAVYQIDKDRKWLDVMRSISEHAIQDYRDFEIAPGIFSCAYTPNAEDKGGVINASAYRAFLLVSASEQFAEDAYRRAAEGNLNFVLKSQQPNGSWLYAADSVRDFVDHFHTCFVLKALAKIEKLTAHEGCSEAINKGVEYYVRELFDKWGLPKPFSKAPRSLTQYRRVLYDYAECINLGVLLKGRFEMLDMRVSAVLNDLLDRWQKKDGSFYARELFLGWDAVPMHRYAQSQVFRALCYFLNENRRP